MKEGDLVEKAVMISVLRYLFLQICQLAKVAVKFFTHFSSHHLINKRAINFCETLANSNVPLYSCQTQHGFIICNYRIAVSMTSWSCFQNCKSNGKNLKS